MHDLSSGQPPRLALLGAGAVGRALARSLSQAGYTLTAILDRQAPSARELAREVSAGRAGSDPALLRRDTDLLIVAVPDGQIAAVDRAVARRLPELALAACLHTSGALPGSEFQRLAQAGVAVGSLHPLQTFPARGPSPALQGTYFALEGDSALVASLRAVVERLGGIPVEIRSEGKAAYHAAAVFASNFLPVLLRLALELLTEAGVAREQGSAMLAPLMRRSLENVLTLGETAALTGPVARGDAATVQRHREALNRSSPAGEALYRMLSLKALELALEQGLDSARADLVQEVLT